MSKTLIGPYAGGPPPSALEVDTPPLSGFGAKEALRLIEIAASVTFSVTAGLLGRLVKGRDRSWGQAAAEGLVRGFERLGPTFVKLGQIIASSPGIFPAWLADACLRCLHQVAPFTPEQVHQVIEEDLGHPAADLFAEFGRGQGAAP
jgi:predicted unusual protein kinase regulating ubiquinone biosynthesis (AarF/ABC1/UbiB family)